MKLKEIVGYLPYGLMMYGSSEIWKLIGIDPIGVGKEDIGLILENGTGLYDGASILEHSPILRPLSDLTKKITVDGEEFVPISILYGGDWALSQGNVNALMSNINDEVLNFPYKFIQLLYKWHFDIHGLIERGEAIDMNEVD